MMNQSRIQRYHISYLSTIGPCTCRYIFKIPYSWKFSRDLYFKNFVVQTKFVKYRALENNQLYGTS